MWNFVDLQEPSHGKKSVGLVLNQVHDAVAQAALYLQRVWRIHLKPLFCFNVSSSKAFNQMILIVHFKEWSTKLKAFTASSNLGAKVQNIFEVMSAAPMYPALNCSLE